MLLNKGKVDVLKLRDMSSVFSRSAFLDVLQYNDFTYFNWLYTRYHSRCSTYESFIRRAYSMISKEYRCEYVYKNELIRSLLNKYGSEKTVYFSEFRIADSIADLAMFNGECKVFEIKTEYDTPRRLDKQMNDYRKFFDRRYIVIPECKLNDYLGLTEETAGIILLKNTENGIVLDEIREASQNYEFDSKVMISCLQAREYEAIASALGADVQSVLGYDRFRFCSDVFEAASPKELKRLFLQEIKKRKNNTKYLCRYPLFLRQMMLSLNLSEAKADLLLKKLKITVLHS